MKYEMFYLQEEEKEEGEEWEEEEKDKQLCIPQKKERLSNFLGMIVCGGRGRRASLFCSWSGDVFNKRKPSPALPFPPPLYYTYILFYAFSRPLINKIFKNLFILTTLFLPG